MPFSTVRLPCCRSRWMDAREQLRKYLEQRRDAGERELTLDTGRDLGTLDAAPADTAIAPSRSVMRTGNERSMWRRLESFWPNSMIGSRCSIGNLRTITSHLVRAYNTKALDRTTPQRGLAKSLGVPIRRTNRISRELVRSRPSPRVMRLEPVGSNDALTVARALKQGQRPTREA